MNLVGFRMSNIFNLAVENLVTPQKRSGITTGNAWPFFNFGSLTDGAKKVNTNTALTISAFYCGVKSIADSMALLPFSVMQNKDNQRTLLPDHPAHYILYREPNSSMTAYSFKFIMAIAVLMRGNAFALIQRDQSGNVMAYQFLDPDTVTVISSDGKLFYKVKNEYYTASEIIHIPGFSFDGITGKSVIQYAADSLGVTLAAQKFGSDSLTDRGISAGVVETDKSVVPDKKREISDAVASRFASGNKYRVAMLDEGMKYKSITLTPQEAQFIEAQQIGVEDVARWLQIPLHKLHAKGEGGYNFIVEMSNEYLQTAVMPMAEKFKQEFERKTFTPSERKAGIYIFQNYKKLLQINPAKRGQFYKDMVLLKAMTPNEVRELEDMNPYEGGNDFLQMSNLLNEDQLKKMVSDES